MTDTRTTTRNPLDTSPVPVQGKLAAAWASLYKPGVLEDILTGIVFEFVVSPALLTVFLVLVSVPALMVALSAALPAHANRLVNLVVAALYIPITVFNAVGESWEWAPFYALSIGLELLLLAYILRTAVTWPRRSAQ